MYNISCAPNLCVENICPLCSPGKLMWPFDTQGVYQLRKLALGPHSTPAPQAGCSPLGAPTVDLTAVHWFMQLILKRSESHVYLYTLSALQKINEWLTI